MYKRQAGFFTTFLAGAFLDTTFLVTAFLAGAFLDTAFLVTAFLVTAFLAGAFLDTAFLVLAIIFIQWCVEKNPRLRTKEIILKSRTIGKLSQNTFEVN